MSKDEKLSDEIVSRLKLDIRALTLLYESDSALGPILERTFVHPQDEYVARFMRLVQPQPKSEGGGNIQMAVGEIVLASFLSIIGLTAFAPVMLGLSAPQQWLSYFSSTITSTFVNGPLFSFVPLLDFAFAALLLLGAFYSLRKAARNLKNSGLILESSGK